MFNFPIGDLFDSLVRFLRDNLGPVFDGISWLLDSLISAFEFVIGFAPAIVTIVILALLAWKAAGKGIGVFTLVGLILIDAMGLWMNAVETLSLVLVSAIIALIIGIPLGIIASRSHKADNLIRPVLDFMQTMPAFVYLIPAVFFFGLGKVPGAVATIIFSMPPVVRLTNLGIRQVPVNVEEAGRSFGSTPKQMLFKIQLPIALPTILAGINQTIMLALSMVVISAMIGAQGLGSPVYSGIQNLRIGQGFEGGLAVVILAMILDRVTQALGDSSSNK